MNVTLWVIAIVLAVVFGAAGFMKATTPKEKLAENIDPDNDDETLVEWEEVGRDFTRD